MKLKKEKKEAPKPKSTTVKGKCFHYNIVGHWKRNYRLYQESLYPNRPRKGMQHGAEQGIYMIKPYNFSICDTADWVLDIGSPIHICNLLQEL